MRHPKITAISRLLLFGVLQLACLRLLASSDSSRVQITTDTSEADQVLAIVAKHRAGNNITEDDWKKLFETTPYQRLEKREASLHRDFTDEQFKQFVLSDELSNKYDALASTLAAWKTRDLTSSAQRILQYLPKESVIRASVYPMIKPKHNSFVFEPDTNAAIFLYLDPSVPAYRFENTVAHEMHHIGLASNAAAYEKLVASLPEGPKKAAEWMGGFGEGWAVLAAAGGPTVDPQKYSSDEVKANWSRAATTFNSDFADLNDFFTQVATGKLDPKKADERAMSYFGDVQGPWYTVGYRMAVAIESRLGREALIGCMRDPRQFLVLWNQIAGPGEPKWNPELINQVRTN